MEGLGGSTHLVLLLIGLGALYLGVRFVRAVIHKLEK